MWKTRLLAILICVVYLLFVYFQVKGGDGFLMTLSEVLLVPMVAFGYFAFEKKKTFYFSGFILLFALSELLDLFVDSFNYEMYYLFGNALYMVGYTFLLLEILKSTDFNYLLKRFKVHFIVLIALDIYMVYVLQSIVDPFIDQSYKYYMEMFYNLLMVVVLSIALLNYVHKENRKATFLFLGSVLIVFSEVIWTANTYIVDIDFLGIISKTLALAAFFCFYVQVQYLNEEGKDTRVKLDNKY
ncbi:FUSC family protein [Tamlana agarivorans]|uniref:FUSC family protein n=1 Tax=Pseudotamlana agarivorans TaxID=481183 RepID=A0ACC5UBG1_9FLAO|nr:FUSC family protein [Tamlana agarivorans]MBU2951647.1 FUSC family protein [Tamlana agarivorans]